MTRERRLLTPEAASVVCGVSLDAIYVALSNGSLAYWSPRDQPRVLGVPIDRTKPFWGVIDIDDLWIWLQIIPRHWIPRRVRRRLFS